MALQPFGRTKNIANRSKRYLEESLYVRLFKDGSSEVSVRQQLNQFLKSSKKVYKWEVGDTIKKLRSRGLYGPAFKVPAHVLYFIVNAFQLFLEYFTMHVYHTIHQSLALVTLID